MSIYRFAAISDHWAARLLRRTYRGVRSFSVPTPGIVVKPVVRLFLVLRHVCYFVMRVFFCEPFLKAHCAQYGSNVHTDIYLPYIEGSGEILLGDDVTLDGRVSINFAARYTERPRLIVGNHSGLGHNCVLSIGGEIRIGNHCRIAGGVHMFDSPGHPLEAEDRKAGLPARLDQVRPIVLQDNVWIGAGATVFPGVTIGENSVVAA